MITKTPMMVPMMPLFMVALLPSADDGRTRPWHDRIGSHPSGAEEQLLRPLVRVKVSQSPVRRGEIDAGGPGFRRAAHSVVEPGLLVTA